MKRKKPKGLQMGELEESAGQEAAEPENPTGELSEEELPAEGNPVQELLEEKLPAEEPTTGDYSDEKDSDGEISEESINEESSDGEIPEGFINEEASDGEIQEESVNEEASEDALQEEDWEEDTWEEEQEPDNPWKATLVFLGLAVLAAVICGILWYFTHRDNEEEPGQDHQQISATAEPAVELEGEHTFEPAPEQDASASAGPGTESEQESVQEPVSGNDSMAFTTMEESVTPKDAVNLRSQPSTQEENIVALVENGTVLTRTGVNEDTGWSKVVYQGQTLYAVSQYLTTDLNYKTENKSANRVSTMDGRVIVFMNCDDWVTPKEYVNLRTEPSTSEGNATVSCQIRNGEKVHRTGFSPDAGWSRVEYDGQVLYVVTSYVYEVTETEEE